MTKTFLRVFFSYILSLFIVILSLGAGLCHYAQTTVCNQDMLLQVAEESGYTRQLHEEIAYNWENLLSITGVETPEDIMAVLTAEVVARDALGYIADSYTGAATLDTQQLRSELDAKVREYAYSHNIYATPQAELEQNINDLVDACISDYQTAITISLLPKLLGAVSRYGQVLPKCIPVLAAGCGIMALFLFFLQKKRQDVLYYTAISGITGGIILVGIPALVAHYNIIRRLPIADSPLKTLLCSYLQAVVDAMNGYGMYFLYAAAAIFGLYILVNLIILVVKYCRERNAVQTEAETE